MSAKQVILFEKKTENIALVTLNRPEARNAVNDEVAKAMDAIVKQTEADPAIRVVVLTGSGDIAFSAGADLKMISQGRESELGTPDGGFAGLVFHQKDKPWIAAVGGFALAGGLELALSCDMIVASENAVFGLPEVTRGIIAAAGGMYRLPRVLPRAIALEIITTGGRFSAQQALQYGMINRLVSHESLLDEAFGLAQTIADNAPLAVIESLKIARLAFDKAERELIHMTEEGKNKVFQSEDAREGPLAFVEKRKPVWKGK